MSNKFRSYSFVWESSGNKLVGIYQNLVGIYQKLVGIYQTYIPVMSQSDYSICNSYDLICFNTQFSQLILNKLTH